MNEKLHKYLDGELSVDALSPDERAEAEDWQALLADAARLRSVKAPAWLETRVMANLPEQPQGSRAARILEWFTAPQPVRVRPLWVSLAGVAAVLLLFFARTPPPAVPVTSSAPTAVRAVSQNENATIYVHFVLADRNARSVTIAGDFNDWDTAATPLADPDGNGVWTGLVALRPGLHKYMFVVDGKRWVTDPEAENYIDDGFGMRNAVITITPPPTGRAI